MKLVLLRYMLKDVTAEFKYKFNLRESLNRAREAAFLAGVTIYTTPCATP